MKHATFRDYCFHHSCYIGYAIMTRTNQLYQRLGEWLVDDLRLQTDKIPTPFSCGTVEGKRTTDEIDRIVALAAMYIRLLEQAEQLGLLRIGESSQVKRWLRSGVLFR